MKNKQQLMDLIKKHSSNSVVIQNLTNIYFFGYFIKGLKKSKYSSVFALKGGFKISYLVGFDSRVSNDIDLDVNVNLLKDLIDTNNNLDRKSIEKVFREIIEIINNDINKPNFKFSLVNVNKLFGLDAFNEKDTIKIKINVVFDDITSMLNIDISKTYLDVEMVLEEIPIFLQDEKVLIYSYPVEFILADKIHSIFLNPNKNSRIKDYYDFHLLIETMDAQLDMKKLKLALWKVFEQKENNVNEESTKRFFENPEQFLKQNFEKIFKKRIYYENNFTNFIKKYGYDTKLEFATILEKILVFVESFKNSN